MTGLDGQYSVILACRCRHGHNACAGWIPLTTLVPLKLSTSLQWTTACACPGQGVRLGGLSSEGAPWAVSCTSSSS